MFRKLFSFYSAPSQRKRKDRPKIGEAELDLLLKKGESLAKSCVLLRKEGTAFAALWGGDGVLPAPRSVK